MKTSKKLKDFKKSFKATGYFEIGMFGIRRQNQLPDIFDKQRLAMKDISKPFLRNKVDSQ